MEKSANGQVRAAPLDQVRVVVGAVQADAREVLPPAHHPAAPAAEVEHGVVALDRAAAACQQLDDPVRHLRTALHEPLIEAVRRRDARDQADHLGRRIGQPVERCVVLRLDQRREREDRAHARLVRNHPEPGGRRCRAARGRPRRPPPSSRARTSCEPERVRIPIGRNQRRDEFGPRHREPHDLGEVQTARLACAQGGGGLRSGIWMRASAFTRNQNIVPASATIAVASSAPRAVSALIRRSDQITISRASSVWKPSTAQ